MLFSTPQFFLFFLVVLVLFYAAPRAWGRVILLVASYYFYARWNWKFIPLLLSLTVIDYIAAIWIEEKTGAKRRFAIVVSIAANLGFLGFFKYYNFAASNFASVLGLPPNHFFLAVVLPLGISFHTFQSISYVVDVYRGQQKAIRRPIDYALFISFFPQLVAGPIVRARNFFADLDNWQPPTQADIQYGSYLIAMGLTKKIVLADNFAAVADPYFGSVTAHPGGTMARGAVFAFTLQIFFDFSGYTDIAIGLARLLGFHFPINFRRPYLATSISDFWRRWHISLSTWLRDYLYIPLGGSRRGSLLTYRNLMLTMLLGGLWHGASWNFVIWGGYQGVLLSVERLLGLGDRSRKPGIVLRVPAMLITFALVSIGWVFFRAPTLPDSLIVLRALFARNLGNWPVPASMMCLAAASLVIAVLEERFGLGERISRAPMWSVAAVIGVLLFLVELFGQDKSIPFIYFQF